MSDPVAATDEGQNAGVDNRSQSPRGALRVFLGCAPGVGKTYEMLAQAHALRDEDVDVVVGVVEDHGRTATAAMAQGLERVPLRSVEHRGTALTDMDVDAVIARDPDVVLVDELAHTNAPGSSNSKRWQDINDLLDAGIDVLSTVNVQHLESLNDVVADITGAAQHETVPDEVVRAADQIELIDIAPEALRQRLSAGKVYPGERIGGALSNYFRQGNLTALRELSLLWVADRVDEALAAYRSAHSITDVWEARERVVVAVTGGPESPTLVRRASRIASRSSAELVVVHIVRGDGLLERGATNLPELTALAASVGARLHSVVGDNIPDALLEFARAVNATQLVLGTSRRSRWQRFFDEGVGATVVRQSGRIDVHMVTHERSPVRNRLDIRETRLHRPLSWVLAVVIPILAAAVLSLLDRWLGFASESAIFFAVILAVSLLGGVGPAALSALLSGFLLNFLYTSPRYSLTINEPDNAITLLVMLVMAIAVAVLVDSATVRRREALAAARDAELLTLFSNSVLHGADLDQLLERVRAVYQQRAVSLVDTSRSGKEPALLGSAGDNPPLSEAVADTVCPVEDARAEMLLAGPRLAGRERRVLNSVAAQAATLVQQRALAEQASSAAALAETERLQRALLAAVSHDLRTPLAAVKASVSSLRSDDVEFSPDDTAELLAAIEESADQLSALVGNLLDSSRLSAGVVSPDPQLIFVTEVVARAVLPLGRMGSDIDRVRIDVDGVWVRADAGLLERVLANLIDNALRHSPATEVVNVTADALDDGSCQISVIDHGPGVPTRDREAMFQPFQRLGDRDAGTGVGLGLSVASGFVEAMGGTLKPERTSGGGLTMVVTLPGVVEDE